MSESDRVHWDARYTEGDLAPAGEHGPPSLFAPHEDLFPTEGNALDLACGRGRGSLWLASRGMRVWGVDISPVAIDLARRVAEQAVLASRCRFDVFDLDGELPPGPSMDVVFCYLFRDPRLYQPMMERLSSGGILALAVLSEVGVGPGQFRARPGELQDAFASLDVLGEGEGDGRAWILARRAK